MHFTRRGSFAAAIALGAMILAVPALAEDGVTADTITFGQAAVLEGPASALGLGMQKGLNAAFDEINAEVGVPTGPIRANTLSSSISFLVAAIERSGS